MSTAMRAQSNGKRQKIGADREKDPNTGTADPLSTSQLRAVRDEEVIPFTPGFLSSARVCVIACLVYSGLGELVVSELHKVKDDLTAELELLSDATDGSENKMKAVHLHSEVGFITSTIQFALAASKMIAKVCCGLSVMRCLVFTLWWCLVVQYPPSPLPGFALSPSSEAAGDTAVTAREHLGAEGVDFVPNSQLSLSQRSHGSQISASPPLSQPRPQVAEQARAARSVNGHATAGNSGHRMDIEPPRPSKRSSPQPSACLSSLSSQASALSQSSDSEMPALEVDSTLLSLSPLDMSL